MALLLKVLFLIFWMHVVFCHCYVFVSLQTEQLYLLRMRALLDSEHKIIMDVTQKRAHSNSP